MPTNTDLVSQLPADFEVFGQAVDTSLADLKGGTTGQILSKASNTDMDFTWTAATSGDITGVSVTSPITGGGTSGDVTIGIASTAVVPSQTGQSGKYLTTDGTASSWGSISAGGYTSLASGSLSGNTLQLSSISGSYKSLRLILSNYFYDTRGNMQLTFNGDTASNYTTGQIEGIYSGTTYNPTAYSATGWPSSYAWLGNGSNVFNASGNNTYIFDVPNYTDTNAFKIASGVVFQRDNTSQYCFQPENHLWRGTAAITSIRIKAEGTRNFNGGTYTLLGLN